MLLQFVLGTVYFVAIVTVLSISLAFISIPVLQEAFHQGAISLDASIYFFPVWSYPLLALGGLLLWTVFMNLVRGVGQLHGKMAKWLLVTE